MEPKSRWFVLVSITYHLFGFGLIPVHSLDDSCKNEVTYGFHHKYVWNVSTTTGFYVSEPNCFDENSELVERQCIDSIWIPEDVTCHETLQRNLNLRKPANSTLPQVETILTFDSKLNRMFLMIYFAENVNDVSCYTFAIKNLNVTYDLILDSINLTSSYYLKRYFVYELDIFDHPSEYWCEISQKSNSTKVITEKVVGHKEDHLYQEFVMKATFSRRFSFDDIEDHCDRIDATCRVMKIVKRPKQKIDAWIHVTLYFKSNKVVNGYNKLRNYFQRLINLKYVLSADFCLPNKTYLNKDLYWKLTPRGEKAKPSQLCLNEEGFLITRKCIGDFLHGAYFEEFKQKCSETIPVSKKTVLLYEIVSKHNFTAEIFKNFSSIIKDPEVNVSLNDVSLFSDGLFETSELDFQEEIEDDYFDIVNMLNSIDSSILTSSQIALNATDKILDSLEKFIVRKSETRLNDTNPTAFIQKKNFVIYATKPSLSNISGIALYGKESDSLLDYALQELTSNDSLVSISKEHLELAVHVPTILLDLNGNSSLIITIYSNDSLFNEENVTNSANSRVIGITMSGLGKYLETPIPLVLRPLQQMNKTFSGCGYWQYGQASPSRKGQWSTKGGEDVDFEDLIYCTYSHLTHFGLLILSGRSSNENEGVTIISDPFHPYTRDLSIITIVGCALSLVGISGIFITTFIFRRFREKIGTKILLLLSVPISLEIILTQLAGLDNWHSNDTICKIIGILLHYMVLLKFSWMFVIALLQYLRFVKVLGPMPQRIFLKANLICWLIPTIPVILSAGISPESYTAGVQKFCYPKDWALYLGLFTPASIIIAFNILVFIMIMVSISNSKAVKYDKSGKMLKRQTYLAILLFFMLGIPWLFGILAEILPFGWLEITFVYLFCLTATLQGFILFVFYVVLDKETRSLWVGYTIKQAKK